MILEDTIVVRSGDSRPCGPAGACSYCQKKIGAKHGPDCVCVKKTFVVRMTVEYVVAGPAHWTEQDVNFHRNESSWCAQNALDELDELVKAGECLCSRASFEFVREATEEDHDLMPESVLERMRSDKS